MIACPFCFLFFFGFVGLVFSFSWLTCIKCDTPHSYPIQIHITPSPYTVTTAIAKFPSDLFSRYFNDVLSTLQESYLTILFYFTFHPPFFLTLWKLRCKFLGPRQDLGPWRRESESLGNILETEDVQYRAKEIPYTSSV